MQDPNLSQQENERRRLARARGSGNWLIAALVVILVLFGVAMFMGGGTGTQKGTTPEKPAGQATQQPAAPAGQSTAPSTAPSNAPSTSQQPSAPSGG